MKILQVGNFNLIKPRSGEEVLLDYMSKKFLEYGFEVHNILFVPAPEVKIANYNKNNINYWLFYRPKPFVYMSLHEPISEVYDEISTLLMLEFLKRAKFDSFDVVIWHSAMPLSLIELLRNYTSRLYLFAHSLYYINPFWFDISVKKIQTNVFQCFSYDNISVDNYLEDLHIQTNNQFRQINSYLKKQLQTRIEYGQYILNEIADYVFAFMDYASAMYFDYNISAKKLRKIALCAIEEPIDFDFVKQKYQQKPNKFVIGCLGNWQYLKGQHILVKSINEINLNDIVCQLYGSTDLNINYKNLLAELINPSLIQIKDVYDISDIKSICNNLHIHVLPMPTKHQTALTIIETLYSGVTQILTEPQYLIQELNLLKQYKENNVDQLNSDIAVIYELYLHNLLDKLDTLLYNFEFIRPLLFKCGDYITLKDSILFAYDNFETLFDYWQKQIEIYSVFYNKDSFDNFVRRYILQ